MDIKRLIVDISDSFFNVLQESVGDEHQITKTPYTNDEFLIVLIKENRYMYLTLLIIFLLVIANILYIPPNITITTT